MLVDVPTMNLGLFGMNITGGLLMTKNPQWQPTIPKIIDILQKIEHELPDEKVSFLPISRWKGYGGANNIAADAIESLILSSALISNTNNVKVYGSFSTFAYEPEVLGHAAARLNYEYNNRFGINLIGGWKKDEFDYFNKEYYKDSKETYEKARLWLKRFRHAEAVHTNTLENILGEANTIKSSDILCAAFSNEGREFVKDEGLGLFTTVRKIKEKNVDSVNGISCAMTVFVREKYEDAKEYYSSLLGDNASDEDAANNFCKQLADNNPIKAILNRKNIQLVKSGAGIEEVICSKDDLISLMSSIKEKRLSNIFFALPDYKVSLDLLIDCWKQS